MQYRVCVCESAPQTRLRLSWELHPDRLGIDIAAGMRALTATAERAGLTACGAPTITYREKAEPGGVMDVDLAVPVDLGTALASWPESEVVVEPRGLVARTCHRGGYDRLDTAYRVLDEWIRESGYRSAGPPTQAFLIGPDETTDPRRLITEIRIPVTKAPVVAAHMDRPFEQAIAFTRQVLARQGFEVVAETDLRALLHNKLGEHIQNYVVVNAYHPALTARMLAEDPQAAWLASVTVAVRADGTVTAVEARDPTTDSQEFGNPALSTIAEELEHLITETLDTLHTPDRFDDVTT
jgi:uncharacterized protein (DUF302 family)/effector-binding domain-containing protein